MTVDQIPFQIDTSRVIELLGKQLYQSPLALLRENTQNAYDALLLRQRRAPAFQPRIQITLSPDEVVVTDNGIGMTVEDLGNHFWFAGSSSKNTEEARAAGVVGTFGIGAMANFGIAGELVVETESLISGMRTRSRAARDKLTLNHKCIDVEPVEAQGTPGTTVTARVLPANRINVAEATSYIADFVALLEIPVTVNGRQVSGQPVERFVPRPASVWTEETPASKLGPRLTANVQIIVSQNADVWLHLRGIKWSGKPLPGFVMLRSGTSALRTYRSGFGLATVGVGSHYQFGGVADLLLLQPTAGREALTSEGMQFLQSVMGEVDGFVSTVLAARPESDSSTPFMSWIVAHGRYELCRNLRVSVQPGDRLLLSEIEALTTDHPMLLYQGSDAGVIARHGSEEKPLLVLARSQPRRQCETMFLQQRCKTEVVSDNPGVTRRKSVDDLTLSERSLAFRVESILDADYFLKVRVSFGEMSHGLPLLATRVDDRVEVTLDSKGQAVALILGLYDAEYAAFGSMVKDFVRTAIFPRVSDFVPSSTGRGAEAFLRMIRAKGREVFEYEDRDQGDLPTIWADYADGKLTMEQAVDRSLATVRGSVQYVDNQAAARVRDVVPDVIQNEQTIAPVVPAEESLDAVPAITRIEISCSAKILTIPDTEPSLRGYRCFLAITDRVRQDLGTFFLQPHKTSVVWGGQKALFIFLHHSGRFGLYYDLQTRDMIATETGGKPTASCTMVLKDRIFIPIPDAIKASFVPTAGEKKRFEVKGDILRTETPPYSEPT